MKIGFDQICALVIFAVCAALLALHIDSEVKSAMVLAVGFLVGSGYQSRKKATGGT